MMRMSEQRIRVEIAARNDFWLNAVKVEWEFQYPERQYILISKTTLLIDKTWLEDLQRVAGQCFARVMLAPADPGRRNWLRSFLPDPDRQ